MLGCAALFGTILPFVELPFPAQTQAHSYSRDVRIPFVKVSAGHSTGTAPNAGNMPRPSVMTLLHLLSKQYVVWMLQMHRRCFTERHCSHSS